MVWLLVGALSIPLAQDLGLDDQQIALLIASPLLGGAVLRIVAGWSADWIGARRTALAILLFEWLSLLWGWLGVDDVAGAAIFSLSLGVAGASFAVALPMAGRAYPPAAQGLVLGIAGSGNVGTVAILFFAPRWAEFLTWHGVCGVMAGVVAATIVAFAALVPPEARASEPSSAKWWHNVAVLIRRRAAYWLCLLYGVTFGGFVGLSSLLPLFLYEVHGLDAVGAGALAALCGLFGSLTRPLGGYVADRQGGLRTLHYVLPVIAGTVVAMSSRSLPMAVAMMVTATAALGFGNGVVFQLVAEWFPKEIGLASGVVGAAGGVGGFLLPLVVGTLKGFTGSYELGLWLFAGLAICAWGTVVVTLRTRTVPSAESSS